MLASELIAQVRRLGSLGSAIGASLSDTDILAHADEEVKGNLLPEVQRVHEEYFVRVVDVVSTGNRIPLPDRAVGAGVRHVQLVQPGGYSPSLPRLGPEDMRTPYPAPSPSGFIFDGGGIQLVPLQSSGTVRLWYYARPSKLVLESDASKCKLITAVATNTPSAGRTQLTYLGGLSFTTCDVVAQGPAHELLVIGATVHTTSSTVIDVASTDVLGVIRANDYLCIPGYTPFVQLPEELSTALIHRTSSRVLMALGYLEEASAQNDIASMALKNALEYIRPRSDGNPKRLKGGTIRAWARGGYPTFYRWGV